MKASERLKLIRMIADRLSEEEWAIVNLTLEQFQLQVSKTKRGAPKEYILKQIKKAENETLLDLAAHLEIDPPGLHPNEISFWKDGNVRLFISHLARKKETASELRDELENAGITGFVAHADITPSKEWQNEIELALGTCDCLVALMEKGFHASYWTDQEVGYAIARGVPIIPVNMGEPPYGFIAKFQAYKFHDVPKLADVIFKLLSTDKRTSKKVSYAAMQKFEQSKSFAAANYNLRVLKKIKYWDSALLERLRLAPKKNEQIRGSFDVPEGIKALLSKLNTAIRSSPEKP